MVGQRVDVVIRRDALRIAEQFRDFCQRSRPLVVQRPASTA
jgi:hypothetical protein